METNFKILIVEDEALSVLIIQKLLNKMGLMVSGPVATGEEAIQKVKHETPDLILMDIRLAGELDGVEAAEAILSFHQVPIVFLTGYTDEEMRERAERVKPITFLEKPVSMEQIQALFSLIPGLVLKNK